MAIQSPFYTNNPVVGASDSTPTEKRAPMYDAAKDLPPPELDRGGRGQDRTGQVSNRYGRNGAANPSSLAPGDKLMSEGAKLGLAQNEDLDLNAVRDGVRGPQGQTRKVADSNVPVHFAMQKRGVSSGSPGGDVPSNVDKSAVENPVRVPGRK